MDTFKSCGLPKTKRRYLFITALLLIAAVLYLPASASLGEGENRVFDYAELMNKEEIARLEAVISDLRAAYNMDFVILTSYDAQEDESLAYADDFYDYNGFGAGSEWDGFLFFIDMNNRVPTISTCGLMIRHVTDSRLQILLDTAYDYLAQGNFADAAYMTLIRLENFLDEGIPSDQYNIDEYENIDYYYEYKPARALTAGEFLIALVIGMICGLILFGTVKYRYGLKGSTYSYNVPANTAVNITGASDNYLRTNVIKTRKQTSSGKGGSASSTHRSSSGRSHGGGSGRRF